MKVGVQILLQNSGDPADDQAAFNADLALADLVEPLGFDSVWGVEHHFTGYAMAPNSLLLQAYMAGKTKRIDVGSMVVILPWHQPARVAGEVAMLDNLSNGRYQFGIGRGLAKMEFDGFGIPMEESRERFVEAAELVINGLESGTVEYEGKHYQQPARPIRPAPTRSFKGRTYAAAVSPASVEIMAKLGVAILVIPQKPWASVEEDLKLYRETFMRINGVEAPPTLLSSQVFCHEDAEMAEELARKHIGDYYLEVMKIYDLLGDHLKGMEGYEYYAANKEALEHRDLHKNMEFYTNLQIWGTPDQCVEKIMSAREIVNCDQFVGVFRYAGISRSEAERSMRLFASEVRPRLQAVK